jgi:hypothetical protein
MSLGEIAYEAYHAALIEYRRTYQGVENHLCKISVRWHRLP